MSRKTVDYNKGNWISEVFFIRTNGLNAFKRQCASTMSDDKHSSTDGFLTQDYEEWMSRLPEELWDIPLSNLAIPGNIILWSVINQWGISSLSLIQFKTCVGSNVLCWRETRQPRRDELLSGYEVPHGPVTARPHQTPRPAVQVLLAARDPQVGHHAGKTCG